MQKSNLEAILMGGSGSTGSSLLKNILGRHTQIFASQETSLFAKEKLYTDWSYSKNRIFKTRWRGLKNYGFHRYAQVDFYLDEIDLSTTQIKQLIKTSATLPDFAHALFNKKTSEKNVQYWLEKTPANSCQFKNFQNSFPTSKIIHTVRHPLDAIASMMARGHDPYYATCIYLVNTACGLSCRNDENYIEVKYEELVGAPDQTLQNICADLNLKFQSNMLQPKQEDHIQVTKLEGWQYDETQAVGKKSINRFEKLEIEQQHEILSAVASIRINEFGRRFYQTNISSIHEISEILEYDIRLSDLPKPINSQYLKKFKRRDQVKRALLNYPYGFWNYPIDI
mgnify:CR=1 FL=1